MTPSASGAACRFRILGMCCALVALAVHVGACKPNARTRSTSQVTPASAETTARAQPVQAAPAAAPVEEAFVIPDDQPVDPAEAMRALKHDCCDEMPAGQVKADVEATEAAARTQTTRTARTIKARGVR